MSGPVILFKGINYSGSGQWLNETGNSNNATCIGTIAKNSAGNGILFDGSTYWQFGDIGIGNAWTVNVWCRNILLHEAEILTSAKYTNLMVCTADITFLNVAAGGSYGETAPLPTTQWVNIQGTWDGSNLTTYINGSSIGTSIFSKDTTTTDDTYYIGRRVNNTSTITGEIGEIRIYKYALTSTQVLADYNSSSNTFIAPSIPLIFIRPLARVTSVEMWWIKPAYNGWTSLTEYTVSCIDQSFAPVTFTYPTTHCILTGLTQSTPYTFQIVATNSGGSSSIAATFRTVKPDNKPIAPISASATAMTSAGTTVVSWTPASNTTLYGFAIILTSINTMSILKFSASSSQTSRYITGLIITESYTCGVYTVNDAGWSHATNTATIASYA